MTFSVLPYTCNTKRLINCADHIGVLPRDFQPQYAEKGRYMYLLGKNTVSNLGRNGPDDDFELVLNHYPRIEKTHFRS